MRTVEPKSPTRTERRREETRRRLIAAGRDLISERGVAGLRIADVTETADVGRGSFYNHFASKEELVDAVVQDSLAELASTILANIPPDHDPAVRASLADRKFIRLAYDDPAFARLLVNLHHGEDLFAAAVEPFARGELEGGLASGRFTVADLEVLLVILASSALGLIRASLEERLDESASEAHAEAVLLLLGLSREEAHAISRIPLD